MHLVDAYKNSAVSGLAMASIFHFGDNNPIRARAHLKNNKIPIKEV
jgi:cyclase